MFSISRFRKALRSDLESSEAERQFGKGWLSGVLALVLAITALVFVIGNEFPTLFTVPQVRAIYQTVAFHFALMGTLVLSFVLAIISLTLRQSKMLGFTSLFLIVFTTTLGGVLHHPSNLNSPIYFGLDWFVLNLIFTGIIFVPLQLLFPRYPKQELFRFEWREDLFYYFVSTMLVQILTFASLSPAMELAASTHWDWLRPLVASQPVIIQFIEIMFLTDLVQYWVHRAFHRIPWLWNFHAIHHSAQVMDWVAGARMHFMEVIVLRAFTVVPMFMLGYSDTALHFYIFYVYLHSTFVHANFGWNFSRIGQYIVTPRFHHWHHGINKEAIDVNFSIHFPVLDRIFGTYYMPKDQWPDGYGIPGHPVPKGYWAQFWYPFTKK